MNKVLIIGAGVMGSAVAVHLGNNGQKVNLWGTQWDKEILDNMRESGRHKALDVAIPDNVQLYYEHQLEESFKDAKLIIIAVISKGMDYISKRINQYLNQDHIILTVTKGIDEGSLTTMTQVVDHSLPNELKDQISIVKLGGPIIAAELAKGKYTEGIFASKNLNSAKYVSEIFKSPKFRTNVSDDIDGVELCAAFKNTFAIAMGIIQGLEGDFNNPKAAIMARGAIEMATIVEAYGGDRETALGIAGVGDYYVTSQGGRNGIFGYHLGQGKSVEEALDIMDNATVEGLSMTLNGYKLLKEIENQGQLSLEKDTPLFLEIYNILYKEKPIREAIQGYWNR
ncbi:MAG: 2-dehydropantoate 2-reductase N-terminal domain-containing protein [Tissierellaceae bacterium]|nr:2-dehydropantoate 2-reductase N-terminal domain-containing protein [Tissierellaceae bacterium]